MPKIWLKNRKILENGVKIHQKSEEMVPRSVPKAIFEAGRFQEWSFGAGAGVFLSHYDAIWAILGAILGPAGRQGAPKIELVGTKSHQNLKK